MGTLPGGCGSRWGFLGPGSFEAQVYADPDEAADYPDRLWKERMRVTAADQLTARMASGGGYVVRLVKQN